MKRVFFFVLILLTAAIGFAEGTGEVTEITVLTTAPADDPIMAYTLDAFADDYPGIDVVLLGLDLSDGSTMSMDALNAAKTPPNVYIDWVGRVSKFLVPEYALPLQDLIDTEGYFPGVLDPYTRDGDLLGIPQPAGAQGMAINLEIMADIGYEVTADWTVDDFLEMAALVKAEYDGEKWATGMFAANQSGDYLINNWFAAFGADLYQDGDYTQTTIVESGGAVVYEFFQGMVRDGYVPEGAAMLTDDDYVLYWARGELAASAFFPGWVGYYQGVVAAQGYEAFDFVFMPFPSATDHGTPTYVSSAAVVVANTGTDADAIAARFADIWNGDVAQTMMTARLQIPNRSSAYGFLPTNARVAETVAIVEANGIMDVGLTGPHFAAVRPQHYPVLQKVLNLAITPDDAIAEYAARVNAALAD